MELLKWVLGMGQGKKGYSIFPRFEFPHWALGGTCQGAC